VRGSSIGAWGEYEGYYFGERVHGKKVVPLGKIVEMVCIEVVLGSNLDRVVVVLKVIAHDGHEGMVWVIGDMVDMDHRKLLGVEGLVSMVEVHVEDRSHMHMVVVIDYHKKIHHSY